MSILSSPIVYPPSSSPAGDAETRKRPHDKDREDLKPKKRLFGRSLFDSNRALLPIDQNVTRILDSQEHTLGKILLDGCKDNQATLTKGAPESHTDTRTRTSGVGTWIEPIVESYEENSSCSQDNRSSTLIRTSNGRRFVLRERVIKSPESYQEIIAQRSHTEAGRATKSYYGVDIHNLLQEAKDINLRMCEEAYQTPPIVVAPSSEASSTKNKDRMMWAEKYRAKKFTDLVGDERTHRSVLRWLKSWDPTVFPGSSKRVMHLKPSDENNNFHKKILLLTGPPGLGKTTLAHVCARQAGYEVVEINASDERNRDIVKGKIRDCVGTENVRGAKSQSGEASGRKSGRPVCVVVDEVDGVVGGSGGSGDGGFMKALIDLVHLDQKSSSRTGLNVANNGKKGDQFRLLRPLILICNDLYHPSLRPLRSSNIAEVIHVRKPPIDKVVARLKQVFEKEAIPADTDGIRRLCEATWGTSSKREDRGGASTGDGDIRAVLVVSEWAASKLRASTQVPTSTCRLTKQWLETHILGGLSSSSNADATSRGLGRGGTKEAAERVFLDNAGFPKALTAPRKNDLQLTSPEQSPASATEVTKTKALELLRSVIDTTGDTDRIVADIFTAYPSRPFHDDTLLSKPNAAAEWLSFHDTVSSKVHGASQSFELMPYLSTSVLAFHTIFANARSSLMHSSMMHNDNDADGVDGESNINPFQGPRADFVAFEQQKQSKALLGNLQSSLSIQLSRTFRSPEQLATDLVPFLNHMLNPSVVPVLVGGSGGIKIASVRRDVEKEMVKRAVNAMGATGVELERMRVEDERAGDGGWVYRMEPPVDTLAMFETSNRNGEALLPARFAVRQVLAQEHTKWIIEEDAKTRQARFEAGGTQGTHQGSKEHRLAATKTTENIVSKRTVVKKDFFGRVIEVEQSESSARPGSRGQGEVKKKAQVWVSYHEGFSNAVRKPISLAEIMASL